MNGPWHAGRLIFALARHYDWHANRMMTEFELDGGRCDLMMVSRAGYVTEFEIKISVSDWNADQGKQKWQRHRPHVARFFYVVPETLEQKVPGWLPDETGLIVIRSHDRGFDTVHELRPARRRRADKLPPPYVQALVENTYYRYWRQQMASMNERLSRQRRMREATA